MINSLQESDSKLLFVFIEGAFFFFFFFCKYKTQKGKREYMNYDCK